MAPIDWGLIRSKPGQLGRRGRPGPIESGQRRGLRRGQVALDRLGLAQALDEQPDCGLHGTGYLVD